MPETVFREAREAGGCDWFKLNKPVKNQTEVKNMSVISMKQLLEAGVHFGHQTRRWNPKMAPYMMSYLSKTVLIFDMLAGRLELFPVLVLLSPGTWKRG